MKIRKLQFKKIKKLLIELPDFLAIHAFLLFLFFFFLALIIAAAVFYKYNILLENERPIIFYKQSQFNENLLEDIMKILEQREKKFNEIDSEQYLDPFQFSPLVPSVPSVPSSPSSSPPPTID